MHAARQRAPPRPPPVSEPAAAPEHGDEGSPFHLPPLQAEETGPVQRDVLRQHGADAAEIASNTPNPARLKAQAELAQMFQRTAPHLFEPDVFKHLQQTVKALTQLP